jgi:hypothetical protein
MISCCVLCPRHFLLIYIFIIYFINIQSPHHIRSTSSEDSNKVNRTPARQHKPPAPAPDVNVQLRKATTLPPDSANQLMTTDEKRRSVHELALKMEEKVCYYFIILIMIYFTGGTE